MWDNYSFTSMFAPYRFFANLVPEEKRDAGAMAFMDMRMKNALKTLESHMQGREWVALDRPTIADISIAGYCYYGDEVPFDFADYPAIAASAINYSCITYNELGHYRAPKLPDSS